MKKTWSMPQIENLKINNTEYHPQGGKVEDGEYNSYDGKKHGHTYAESDGQGNTVNDGDPITVVTGGSN